MKTYQYLEVNPARGIIFALVYVAILVTIAASILGGFYELAGAVNNFGSAKAIGFLVALICILPIFFLAKLLYSKVTINTFSDRMVISRKKTEDKIILYSDIYTLGLNTMRLNTLVFYDQNGNVLFTLLPFNNHHILQQIINDIKAQGAFHKTAEQKKFFTSYYDAITYKR